MKRASFFVAALTSVALLAGCTSATTTKGIEETRAYSTESSSSVASSPVVVNELLANYSFTGMSARQIIDQLEATPIEEKPTELNAVVGARELRLSDATGEHAELPLGEEMYVAFAPYMVAPHECTLHALTTNLGELPNATMHVTITSDAGETIVDEDVTTYESGFFGKWLPRDFSGTISVEYAGKSGITKLATNDAAPTCVTDIKLS
ncbi:CueP family metal-binding protein [Arcanobacterium haemolyticum]|nr:CueP family metal-binding protein [Arcanobacterium haemolyticum]